jgi:hypothetical protein
VTRPVEVHIDRLVLDGVPNADGRAIGGALERELARLLHEEGLPTLPGVRSSDAVDAGVVEPGHEASAAAIGARLARGVYGRLR